MYDSSLYSPEEKSKAQILTLDRAIRLDRCIRATPAMVADMLIRK